MQFDASHLSTTELDVGIDIVDIVMLYSGEYSAEVPNHSCLAAVVDMVVAHFVRTDVLLVPAHVVGLEDGLQLSVKADEFALRNPAVLPRCPVLAKAHAHALGVADLVVLDHPSLAPVRPYQAFLECGWRSPLRGGLREVEAFDCNEVDTGQFWEENRLAHVDLSQFLVGVLAAEIGIYDGLTVIHLDIPAEML